MLDAARLPRDRARRSTPTPRCTPAIHLPDDEVGNCRQFAHCCCKARPSAPARASASTHVERSRRCAAALASAARTTPRQALRSREPATGRRRSRRPRATASFDAVVVCAARRLGAAAAAARPAPAAARRSTAIRSPRRCATTSRTNRAARGADGRALQGRDQPPRPARARGRQRRDRRLARAAQRAPRMQTLYKVLTTGSRAPRRLQPGAALEGRAADAARRAAGARRQRRRRACGSTSATARSGWALPCGSARAAGRPDRPAARRRIDIDGLGIERLCAELSEQRRAMQRVDAADRRWPLFGVAATRAHRAGGAARAAAAHADAARRPGGRAAGAGARAACARDLDRLPAPATTAATASRRRRSLRRLRQGRRRDAARRRPRACPPTRQALAAARARRRRRDSPARAAGRRCDLAIDALLGIGASRPPEGELRAMRCGACTPRAAPVLAVDVPSGLDADTGQPLGDGLRRAPTHTLTPARRSKPGLFTAQGRDPPASVWFDDLGVDADAAPPTPGWSAPARRPHARRAATRRTRAASATSRWSAARPAWPARRCWPRAPRMQPAPAASSSPCSTRGARRSDSIRCSPELMFRAGWCEALPTLVARRPWSAAAAAATRCAPCCRACSSTRAALVLDADALNAIAADAALQALLRRARAPRPRHGADAASARGGAPARHAHRRGPGRSPRARRARSPQRFARVVVLKGSGTRHRRAGRRAGASTPPATPRWPPPAPATCWPAGSAAAGRARRDARSTSRRAASSSTARRPSRSAGALRAADLIERCTGASALARRARRAPQPSPASPCRPRACPARAALRHGLAVAIEIASNAATCSAASRQAGRCRRPASA